MSGKTKPWYGQLPDYWNVKKLKYVVNLRNEKFIGEDIKNYIGLENIESKTGRYLPSMDSELNIEGISNRFYKGDILFGKLRPYLAKCIEAEFDGAGTTELLVLNTNDNFVLSEYLKSMMLSPKFIDYINSSTYGTKMPRANWGFIGNIKIPLPNKTQQQVIVRYLNEKVKKMDELIIQKKNLITLLEQQRQSIITEAVTKGLNPNVKMKDSGVEWIGEIPEHWNITKFKNIAFYQEGPGLRNWQFVESGIPVICVTNITAEGIDFSKFKRCITEEEYKSYMHFTVEPGDLILSSSGNSWGKVAEYVSLETVILNTSTIRINVLKNNKSIKGYLKWLLISSVMREQLNDLMTGSCQPNFGPSHLSKVLTALPSLEEQELISEYLDMKIDEIDMLVRYENQQIEKLKEYCQALLYEAVTGKIDVRDLELN